MKEIKKTNKYKRHLRKVLESNRKGIVDRLETVIEKLQSGERLGQEYRDHLLSDSGSFAGQRECHISGDILLIYILEKDEIILNQIGSHSEVYEQNRKRARIRK